MKLKSSLFALSSLAAALAAAPGPASACGESAYIGQMCIVVGSYCPRNTEEADGQIMEPSEYPALFSLIGCEYGGDCRTTFGLPDMRGRAPTGYGEGPGLEFHPVAERYGWESVTQTIAQMPRHSHAADFTPGGTSGVDVSVAIPAVSGTATAQAPGTTASLAAPAYTDPGTFADVAVRAYSAAAPDTTLKPFAATVREDSSGTVTVAPTGGTSSGGQVPIPTVPPSVAVRYCVVVEGQYPPRPSN